ncbi:MAG: DNA-processing protein DprA [Patescibacteria group bacterium]
MQSHEKKFLHSLLLTGAEYDAVEKLAALESFEQAWKADRGALHAAGLSEERSTAIEEGRNRLNPDEEMRKLVAQNIALAAKGDPEFPQELLEIAQPPFALYIKGRLESGKPRLAVVGTRKATQYGREATRKLIRDLADHTEIEIVSGLAQGIDGEAHRAALEYGLKTQGILGSGMDRNSFFPYEHWNLAEEMLKKGGAVVSEYPPGAPALPHHFPARNRIIASLSKGVLVVEAPEKSGVNHTVRFALEQGREVFAVPGPMFSPNAAGVHRLIQDGAKLVTSADDIIEELGLPRRSQQEKAETVLTGETEKTILEILSEPTSVDELKEKTNMSTPEIVTTLSLLELKGFIRPMGQNRFQRIS